MLLSLSGWAGAFHFIPHDVHSQLYSPRVWLKWLYIYYIRVLTNAGNYLISKRPAKNWSHRVLMLSVTSCVGCSRYVISRRAVTGTGFDLACSRQVGHVYRGWGWRYWDSKRSTNNRLSWSSIHLFCTAMRTWIGSGSCTVGEKRGWEAAYPLVMVINHK